MNPKVNKYSECYDRLMAKARGRKLEGVLCEKHHTIPKSLGGTNTKENLVLLTVREHYVAHLLLTKMYEGSAKQKMYFAFKCMGHGFERQKRYKPNSHGFALRRKILHQQTMPKPKSKPVLSAEEKQQRRQQGREKAKSTIANRTLIQIEKAEVNRKLKYLQRLRLGSMLTSISKYPPEPQDFILDKGMVMTPKLFESCLRSSAEGYIRHVQRMKELNEQVKLYKIRSRELALV